MVNGNATILSSEFNTAVTCIARSAYIGTCTTIQTGVNYGTCISQILALTSSIPSSTVTGEGQVSGRAARTSILTGVTFTWIYINDNNVMFNIIPLLKCMGKVHAGARKSSG